MPQSGRISRLVLQLVLVAIVIVGCVAPSGVLAPATADVGSYEVIWMERPTLRGDAKERDIAPVTELVLDGLRNLGYAAYQVNPEARWRAKAGAQDRADQQTDSRATRAATGRRLALLIGIGNYKWFHATGFSPRVDLNGPPQDLARMRNSLRRFGFDGADNVRVLQDKAASKEGIAAGFRWLSEQVTDSSDVVVIYYSGHGSQAEDADGDEALVTRGDTTDEALVPWDASNPSDPAQLVIDDEIRGWLAKIGTKNVTVIVDACFSGTTTRDGQPGASTWRARGPIGGSSAGAHVDVLQDLDHTLITASSATETAREKALDPEGRTYGVFTYHLTQQLDGASATARYDELMSGIAAQLVPHEQTPQLEGDRSARLFNVHADLPRRQFAKLLSGSSGRYEIDVGAVHGVRETALYDVFGPDETQFEAEPLAQFRVDSVAELRAFGQVVGGTQDLPAGARAVLARVPAGAQRAQSIGVFVDPNAADAARFLDSIPFAQPADSLQADAWVVEEQGAYQVYVDGLEILPAETDSTWTVFDAGSLPLGFAPTRTGLCHGLLRVLSIRSFAAIENPEPPTELGVAFQVVRAGTAPRDDPAAVDTVYFRRSEANPLPPSDDRSAPRWDVYARVDAPEGSRLFLTVAQTGYTTKPGVLFPRSRETMNQPWPRLNEWSPIRTDLEASPPAGSDMLKIVVSSDQFDFHSLVDSFAEKCGTDGGVDRGSLDGEEEEPSRAITGWRSMTRPIVYLEESTE